VPALWKATPVSRWPDDPSAFRPSARWLGVVVVGVMLGVFACIGVSMWVSAHHYSLVSQLTGDWAQSGAGSGDRLAIAHEEKTYRYSATDTVTRDTGALLVSGSISGREVSGRIVVPHFPPWGSTVSVKLLDSGWTIRCEGAGQRLSILNEVGQVTTFVRAP
jgi:hypothetical protein